VQNYYPSIFSIPLFCENFSLDNDSIESFCLSERKSNSGRNISNVGGWQSNDFSLNKPPTELRELMKCIFDFSSKICEFMDIQPTLSGNGWMNINEYGHFNWSHTHPESALSGVYYVKTPDNGGNIEFENPSMSMMTSMRVRNYNPFNSSSLQVPSEKGMMYIFPSWLPHKVHPNLSNEKRISISFNLK